MRINKKFVQGHTGYDRIFGRRFDEGHYVQVDKVFEGIFMALFAVISVAAITVVCVWGFVQWSQVPHDDAARWDYQCDVIAGKNPHFVRSMNGGAAHECVLGPNWDDNKTVKL